MSLLKFNSLFDDTNAHIDHNLRPYAIQNIALPFNFIPTPFLPQSGHGPKEL